jgi:hypothetical protein
MLTTENTAGTEVLNKVAVVAAVSPPPDATSTMRTSSLQTPSTVAKATEAVIGSAICVHKELRDGLKRNSL